MLPATSWVRYTTSCNTQSSAPEGGQNDCPKHVELTGIINRSLLLHLVLCLHYLYFIIFAKRSQFIPLQNVFHNVTCFGSCYLNVHLQDQRVNCLWQLQRRNSLFSL